MQRPEHSQLFPWYDSHWLASYTKAEAIVRALRPDALASFVDAFRVFRTRPDFQTTVLPAPFDAETLAAIRRTVKALRPAELELHEAKRFRRFVVHDHPFFTDLQRRTLPIVSEVVGEPVDVSYNFLSLYTAKGVCAVHMDAPDAKWTFDLCVDQSAPWPIHISDVRPWPDADTDAWGEGWEDAIRRSPSHRFGTHTLDAGQAVVFSGSSQWHYRDVMPDAGAKSFCTALFFHFIPRGTAELVQPKHWARLFGVPELAEAIET